VIRRDKIALLFMRHMQSTCHRRRCVAFLHYQDGSALCVALVWAGSAGANFVFKPLWDRDTALRWLGMFVGMDEECGNLGVCYEDAFEAEDWLDHLRFDLHAENVYKPLAANYNAPHKKQDAFGKEMTCEELTDAIEYKCLAWVGKNVYCTAASALSGRGSGLEGVGIADRGGQIVPVPARTASIILLPYQSRPHAA
jgi:hypothetical protein